MEGHRRVGGIHHARDTDPLLCALPHANPLNGRARPSMHPFTRLSLFTCPCQAGEGEELRAAFDRHAAGLLAERPDLAAAWAHAAHGHYHLGNYFQAQVVRSKGVSTVCGTYARQRMHGKPASLRPKGCREQQHTSSHAALPTCLPCD